MLPVLAAFGLEQRRRVGDRHRLSCRSDLELHIAARVCGCDYLDVLLNILPEASRVHRKLVGPRGHWDDKVPRVGRAAAIDHARL